MYNYNKIALKTWEDRKAEWYRFSENFLKI